MKELRERLGLTTVDVASQLGKSEAAIRFWENGTSAPTVDVRDIPKLLSVYKCTLEEIIEAVNQTQAAPKAPRKSKKKS